MSLPHGFVRHLKARVGGDVHTSASVLAVYSTDASNYRHVPLAVVVPRSVEDVVVAVAECASAGIPVLVRGAGTSLAGQSCNEALVVDTSRHVDALLAVDEDSAVARVEPGIALERLNGYLARHGLCFAPDPSTKDVATLGGMYSNNSCGVRSVRYGPTAFNVVGVAGTTADGKEFRFRSHRNGGRSPGEPRTQGTASGRDKEGTNARKKVRVDEGTRNISDPKVRESAALAEELAAEIRTRFPQIPRRISGYNLDSFLGPQPDAVRGLCGSEGTLAVVTELEVKLVPVPRSTTLAVLAFASIEEAASAVPDLLRVDPLGLEAIDEELVLRCKEKGGLGRGVALLPEGSAWLLVEVDGDTGSDAREKAETLLAGHCTDRKLRGREGVVLVGEGAQAVWRVRKAALAMATLNPRGARESVGWEDAAVPPERLSAYLREFRELTARHGLTGSIFGHFGDGCVHTHLSFDLASEPGREAFAHFLEEAADLVVSVGGSLSGEHGDGQARGALLEKMFGTRLLEAFRRLKEIWDPAGVLNPHRLVDAPPPTADLREAVARAPLRRRPGMTAEDGTLSITEEFDRCVGAGFCVRKTRGRDGAWMCPTYMATLDERHSTRGRSRLLFEVAVGQVVGEGRSEQDVAEALEACIGCKACKSECPAAVDMAAYRAEFFYQRHGALGLGRRSAVHLLSGLSPLWMGLAARRPLRGLFRRLAGSARLGAALGLVDPPELPQPSPRPPSLPRDVLSGSDSGNTVVLWPHCFSRHFWPERYEAAARVLALAGTRPHVPRGRVELPLLACCGRPALESGMVSLARKMLRCAAALLSEPGPVRYPVVVLEPACLSVFRSDSWRLLEPAEAGELAERSFSLSEAVETFAGPIQSPRPVLSGVQPAGPRASVFVHCHQRALWGATSGLAVLEQAGIDAELLDNGCCGMAGSFGLTRSKRSISRAIYDLQVRPSLERSRHGDNAPLVADGFSCRSRLAAAQVRPVVHTAELLEQAMT